MSSMGLQLNIGSGQRPFAPNKWINIDINPRWDPDIVADSANLPMFPDASASIIVAHHVIEHVGLGEFDATIREAHRILMPGGSLIITTPDLRALVRGWMEQRIDDYIFCVNLYGAYMDHPSDTHRWLYHEKTLAQALSKAAPWSQLLKFDWRPIPGASIAKDWWILGAEAIK